MWCCRKDPRKYRYRLTYFDVRGLGEPIRMIFHYEGVHFEDVRMTMEDWQDFKDVSRSGMLPELQIDQKFVLTQSHAIARLLGNWFGLNGKNEWDRALIDQYAGVFKDFVRELNPYLFVLLGRAEGDKKKMRKTLFQPTITRTFPQFVGILTQSTSGFLLSSGLSWVDFYYVEYFFSINRLEPNTFKKYRELLAYVERVHALPNLADYIKIRPSSDV
ncbi:hypothetical protein M3Y99_00974300 [Aphelenchoides fujianensis]|nr:hypothetical protein M3Y99_00974300 [Aphelenchoides fujianensis]